MGSLVMCACRANSEARQEQCGCYVGRQITCRGSPGLRHLNFYSFMVENSLGHSQSLQGRGAVGEEVLSYKADEFTYR